MIAMADGWIKLHNKILENPIICKDTEHLALWVWILLKANHADRDELFAGQRVTIKRGQVKTTIKSISSELHIDESKVRRILKKFKSDKQIDEQTTSRNTFISLTNWDRYQKSDEQNDELVTNKRRASDEQITNKRQLNDAKNNCKIEASKLFEELWKLYPNKKGKGQVSDAAKLRLFEVGQIEMERAIQRYLDEWQKDSDWRKPQNGSTFFNSGYVDYLDKNYVAGGDTNGRISSDDGTNETDSYAEEFFRMLDEE